MTIVVALAIGHVRGSQTSADYTWQQQCAVADLAGVGQVDVSSMQMEASRFGWALGIPLWDGLYDVNEKARGQPADGQTDIFDFQFVYGRFGFGCVPHAAPTFTTSRYENNVDPATQYNLACAQAHRHESGLVILNFGAAWYSAGQYGALLVGSNSFVSTSQIQTALQQYIRGYGDCSSGTGQTIVLAVGTSNSGYGVPGSDVVFAHGAAWAAMVSALRAYASQIGYSSVVVPEGAADFESWGPASQTLDWANGFSSYAAGQFYYYNFGSADGCPPVGGSCNWAANDIYKASWGIAAALPVPEIYSFYHATQWDYLNQVAVATHGRYMVFQGTLTQWGACQVNQLPAECVGGRDPSTGNWYSHESDARPANGWEYLLAGEQSAGRQSSLTWSTDITWSNSP